MNSRKLTAFLNREDDRLYTGTSDHGHDLVIVANSFLHRFSVLQVSPQDFPTPPRILLDRLTHLGLSGVVWLFSRHHPMFSKSNIAIQSPPEVR